MKLRVLALDLDAAVLDGRVDRNVADAVSEGRRDGVTTVLVSGRMLADILAPLPSPGGLQRSTDHVVAGSDLATVGNYIIRTLIVTDPRRPRRKLGPAHRLGVKTRESGEPTLPITVAESKLASETGR